MSKKSVKCRRHHRPFDICYSNRGLQERKQQVVTIIAMSGVSGLTEQRGNKLHGASWVLEKPYVRVLQNGQKLTWEVMRTGTFPKHDIWNFVNEIWGCKTNHVTNITCHRIENDFTLFVCKFTRNWRLFHIKYKGKAFPLQAWTGPWGSRRLRLQNF